jgi:hypothetical protein
MYSYSAYGLIIKCAVPLPDLVESDGPADVVMRFGKVALTDAPQPNSDFRMHFKGGRAYISYRGLGSCEVIHGREIIGDPEKNLDENVVSILALGPGMSMLLHQRGFLTLHASCVKIGETAVAFMGSSGSGKSTIAAAMHVRGHGVVSDDVTVIDNFGPEPAAYPGYPGLHLLPDMANLFRDRLDEPTRIDAEDLKAKFLVHPGFPRSPAPIKRIYLVSDGPNVEMSGLSGHKAVYELINNSYWIRLTHDFRPASYFLQCARLCAQIPIMRLTRPRTGSALPELAKLVEDDLCGDQSSQ